MTLIEGKYRDIYEQQLVQIGERKQRNIDAGLETQDGKPRRIARIPYEMMPKCEPGETVATVNAMVVDKDWEVVSAGYNPNLGWCVECELRLTEEAQLRHDKAFAEQIRGWEKYRGVTEL